ncbi:unnamed protein product [Onchocerca ochengi]|uniref:non-specific serine/threonine protein kinase n=1 Tax=Onchocerca ochengi TaxID=42157 RepID=A0A182EKZ0_ONCOC|nr:unnamed protein product [Onchocerca ochengi]
MYVTNEDSISSSEDVKLKTRFQGQVLVLYAKIPLRMETFLNNLREACKQAYNQPITVKWIDEEGLLCCFDELAHPGDPCTISSQRELDEAIRLLHSNGEAELNVHVFLGIPPLPGLPCYGEDKTVYRRGARRWKKFYHVNGHRFQAKRLNRRVQCFFCNDYIWGLGRQGYRCADCRLCVHKKCHRAVRQPCGDNNNGMIVVPSPSAPVISPKFNGAAMERIGLDNHAFKESEIEAVQQQGLVERRSGDITAKDSKWTVSLNDFNLLTVIGRGSYAKVIQAEHKKTGVIYAIKIIKKQMFSDDEVNF